MFHQIRKALRQQGLTPATAVPNPRSWWAEDATIKPARLVEGTSLESKFVGVGQPWPGSVAYLNGIQRWEVVGYCGASPIVVAEIAAAVRERRERMLHTVVESRRRVAVARPSALAAAGDALQGCDPVPLLDEEPAHPIRELVNAARAVDQGRRALEILLGEQYRSDSTNWLLVDGSLSDSPRWAANPRTVAISKGHTLLPFQGKDLERYLRTPVGHRSSIYAPQTRSLAPVSAWALRLWAWEGKDLLHGLVRIEVCPENGTSDQADQISRWIMAERAPVSAPDRRWDGLLYGIYSVEQYLKAKT